MVPVAEVMDQIPLVAPPPMVAPVKVYGVPEQMVVAEPALTVGASETVSTRVLDTARHGPIGSSVVSVNVTVPLLVEMGVKVTNAGEPVAEVLLS